MSRSRVNGVMAIAIYCEARHELMSPHLTAAPASVCLHPYPVRTLRREASSSSRALEQRGEL
eukprot:scaffold155732_cov30-Prasinocladus_malaysianus.AAC.2